jgi:hypothetical protein
VDYRIPTYKHNDIVPHGEKISKDSELRQVKDWRIYGTDNITDVDPKNGAQRRGKLLPIDGGYNYRKQTIGIVALWANNTHTVVGADDKLAKDFDIMIVNPGEGYANTDTFKVSNANGSSVLLNPIVGGNGEVTGFSAVNSKITQANGEEINNWQTGVDFQPIDFLNADDVLDGSKKPSAKITAVEAAGKDFEGYFVRGWVQNSPILTDYGPKNAIDNDYLQLSPSAPGGDHPSESVSYMINETRTIEANFTKKADDGRYDVYLWMKNDITHCFADNQTSATQKIEQQFINLEILPE